jgi:cytochrome P450
LLRAFTPRSIAGLEPRIRELSRELLAACRARGEFDLALDYAGPLPTIVIAEMLGIPVDDRPRFLRWTEAILGLTQTIGVGAAADLAVVEHAAVKREIVEYLEQSIAQRREQPRDDLIGRLVAAEIDGERLDIAEIAGFFQLLLTAGTETTTNLINNAFLSLLERPDERDRLRAEPGLLPTAIEEFLRYRSPLQMVFREARRAVEMNGRTIPAGAFVLPLIGAANRDPQRFNEPDRLDIGRDPNPHLGFGHGVHFCLGAALARLEARVALPDLLALDLELASDAPWVPRKALLVHGPESLPVRLSDRPSSRRSGT